MEHLIYACCLEDSRSEQADEAFAKLQQAYFDWNEVRVTTVIELGEALSSLPNATQAGHRIKRCLQSLFEARYQYDIDDMKKANLSKATDEIAAWKGISPFVLNYVSQNALGGHAIPADTLTFEVMVQCEILTQAEAEKKSLPGVERAIPKNKGFEFGALLHQFAVEFQQNPKNASVLAVFKELGVSPKAKAAEKPAPKKEVKASVVEPPQPTVAVGQSKSKPVDEPETPKKAEKETAAAVKSKTSPSVSADSKANETKKKVEPAAAEVKKSDAKKPEPKKTEVKKPEVKKTEAKTTGKTALEKPSTKKIEPAKKGTPKTSDKKETEPPAKASPASPAKKSNTAKKPETPKTASKNTSSSNPAKKKPR